MITRKDDIDLAKKITILLVEDDPIAQRLTIEILNSLACEVILAENGQQALDFFNEKTFDIVLMDIGLPDSDGFIITSKLRQAENNAERVPVIGVSAHADSASQFSALQAGMDEYLLKPLTNELCKSILKKYLGTSSVAKSH